MRLLQRLKVCYLIMTSNKHMRVCQLLSNAINKDNHFYYVTDRRLIVSLKNFKKR